MRCSSNHGLRFFFLSRSDCAALSSRMLLSLFTGATHRAVADDDDGGGFIEAMNQ